MFTLQRNKCDHWELETCVLLPRNRNGRIIKRTEQWKKQKRLNCQGYLRHYRDFFLSKEFCLVPTLACRGRTLSFVGCHSLPALTRQILNRPLFNLYLRRIVQYLLQLHPSAFRKQSTSQSLALAWIPPRSGEQCFSIYIQQKMLY